MADELERAVPWWGTDLREHRRGGPAILTGAAGVMAQLAMQQAMDEITDYLKAIDAKGANATAAEKQQREALLATYNAKTKPLNDKTAQVETAIDKSLSDYAKANGFSVIMDRSIAQQSGLVIYADTSTDLTEAVKKTIK